MDSIFAIAAGLGLRFVVDTVSHHDFKLTGTLVGLWEGVILLHFLKKMPKSSDPYIAYVVRLFVDFMVTESVTRLVLVLIWTGLGMILADITPAIWDDVGLKRVWRRFRRDLYTISRMIPTVAFFPPARTVRFSPSRAPSVIPDTERDRDTNTNAPSTFSPSVLTTDRTPTTYAPPTTTATQEIFRRRLPGHFATDFSDTDTDILSVRGRFPSTTQHDNTRTSRRLSMFPAQRDFDTPSDTSTQNELDEDNLSSHSSSHSTERGGPTTSTDLLIDTTQIPDMEVEEEPLVEVAAAVAAVPEKDEAGDVTPTQTSHPMFLPPTPSDSAALFLDRDEPPFTGPDPEHLPQIPDFLEEPVSEDWEKIKKEEADPFYTGNDEKPPTPPAKEYPPGFNPIPIVPSTDVPLVQTEADTAAGQKTPPLDDGWDTLDSQFLSKPNVDDPYTNDATTHGEAPFNFNDPPHRPISQPPAYMESYDNYNNKEFDDIYEDEPDKSFGQDVAGSSFDPAAAAAEEEKRAREEQERIVKEAEDLQRQIEEELERQADERRRREEDDRVATAAAVVAAAAQEMMQKEAEEEAKRKLEEEATRKKQADAAERRRKEEEDAALRLKKREEEAEAEKKREEEEERKRLEDAENERLAAEAEKKRIEEEEAELVRIAAEEAELKRLEEEEEVERLRKEEVKAARKAAKEQKRLEAEAEQKRIEEEERVKKEAEEAEKAKKEEEKAAKRAAKKAEKKRLEEEEAAKKELERLEAERLEQEKIEEERLQRELRESRLAEEERQRLETEEASRLAAEQKEVDGAAAHQPGEEESREQQEEEAKVEDDEAKKAQGEPERQPEEESTAPPIFDDPELTEDALAAQIFALGTLKVDDEPTPADDTNTPTHRDVQLPPYPTDAPEQLVDVEPTGENGVDDADLQQQRDDLMETESIISATASEIPAKLTDRLERQLLLKAQMVDVEALISDLIAQKEGADGDRATQIEQELRTHEKVLRKMKRKEQRRWDDRKHYLSSVCSRF